ncbi:restriction endonuclease [Alteromonas sp. KUL17]|uniref:restriction endonuclease n=1 Tax=Alteromonas sp. KUL17 TaxID=2480796 RepID=UPI001F5F004B|nr:restriction endonuclease [Alteromonas sp. KUL17]
MDYEKEIHEYFSQMYPNSTITYNAKIIGRYSKNERQIDVLIEDEVAGFPVKIVIDAKFFSKNIDVKCVESFISMLDDVDASQGLLITQKGYSKAAINRAYYGPQTLELDILNFDDLLTHQGLGAIPYAGKNSILLSAPFGWVFDIQKCEGFIACLYQRGMTLEQAQKKKEWMYINFWEKDKNTSDITALVAIQNERMKSIYNNLSVNELRAPKRKDGCETYIRVAKFDELTGNEITGFVDYGDFIAFFVMFTPDEVLGRNVRKLSHLLQHSRSTKITFDNTTIIEQAEQELAEIFDPIQRAAKLNTIATWYSQMDDETNSMLYRRLCWEVYPEFYENISPLIRGELNQNNSDAAIDYSQKFFSLAPRNPRVMQDLLDIYESEQHWVHVEKLFERLKNEYAEDVEALGNLYFHFAIYLKNTENERGSVKHFKVAKKLFREVDEKHYVLQLIEDALRK